VLQTQGSVSITGRLESAPTRERTEASSVLELDIACQRRNKNREHLEPYQVGNREANLSGKGTKRCKYISPDITTRCMSCNGSE
jgi:hypothetical protein